MALKQLTTKGRVRKRKDGYWSSDIRYIDENGTRRIKTFSSKTKKEAQQKIRDYKIQFQKEVEEVDETKKTLQGSMSKWLRLFMYPSVARSTYDSKEGTAKNYIYPIIGDKQIGDITTIELKSVLIQMMDKGYAHSTVKKTYTLLNQYFGYLYSEDFITQNTETENGWKVSLRKVTFNKKTNKSWEDYVSATRLEVSCGEAPYLCSRYDSVTGDVIPFMERVGLLDRKLRIVCENTTCVDDSALSN